MILLGQFFGDGETATYDMPARLPRNHDLVVTVDNVEVNTTVGDLGVITLSDGIPAAGTLINFIASPNDVKESLDEVTHLTSLRRDDDGVKTLLTASPVDRIVVIRVKVTEDFLSDGSDAQPIFAIGDEDTSDTFDDGTSLVDAAAGDILVFYGELSADLALIATCTKATGASLGEARVEVTAMPFNNDNA